MKNFIFMRASRFDITSPKDWAELIIIGLIFYGSKEFMKKYFPNLSKDTSEAIALIATVIIAIGVFIFI